MYTDIHASPIYESPEEVLSSRPECSRIRFIRTRSPPPLKLASSGGSAPSVRPCSPHSASSSFPMVYVKALIAGMNVMCIYHLVFSLGPASVLSSWTLVAILVDSFECRYLWCGNSCLLPVLQVKGNMNFSWTSSTLSEFRRISRDLKSNLPAFLCNARKETVYIKLVLEMIMW